VILIVEDDFEIREELVDLISFEGQPVTGVENGAAALAWLEQAPKLPWVILLDLMMPVMDGWEFRAAQRRNPRFAAIPVVLMSGAGDVKSEARALEAQGFLLKPFTSEGVFDALGPFLPSEKP
jgi:CheY-like chemotaxis protein